jgi:hypothetical protein
MSKLAITVCATANYCYAMKTLASRVAANLSAAGWTAPGIAIISGDKSKEVTAAVNYWREMLPPDWKIVHVNAGQEKADAANYKQEAQFLIGRLRSAAFSTARRENVDFCWSLDSDTLPPPNALRCMMDMLRFDAGFYSVSTCPYPNELFLGGRGNQFNQIAPDFSEEERTLPDDLKTEIEALKKEAAESDPTKRTDPPAEWIERKKKVDERIRECPPMGNIWEVTGKHGWKPRGWLDHAYPAIGRGAVVPSDWCGFGCTLMNKEALSLAVFEGYAGEGTEDLFIVWRRWWPAGLRINAITHCPCDHVIWSKKKGGNPEEYTLINSYHETHGEAIGHLRTRKQPWKEF